MMRDDALFNLRWDAQRTALLGSVASLYREESFVDVTIVTNGQMFKAHKLLLSASSPYLKSILESVPSHHAVLFMPHLSASDLSNVLKFIYDGEIKINRRALKSFLETAKLLKIKGMDFDFEGELSEFESGLNQGGGGNTESSSVTPTPAGTSGSVRSNSPPSTTKPSTSAGASGDEEPPEKMKILPALLLNKRDAQTPDSNYQGGATQNSVIKNNNNNNNNNNNRANTSNANLKNGVHHREEEVILDNGDDDEGHGDMDMVMDDEHERSQRMYHMDSDGNVIDIDEEDVDDQIGDYEEEEDVSILPPEVSIQESDESYTINSMQQLQQMRGHGGVPGQMYPDPKVLNKLRPMYSKSDSPAGNYNDSGILMRMMREPLLSSKWSASASAGANAGGASGGAGMGYEVGHAEGVGGLRKTKRYVQCGSCSKVLSSLSALKRHMEDVHCARIQGKCIICGRVYSSRNSLLTHVYSAHKKHEDYKAVARIIRESDFEKFAAA